MGCNIHFFYLPPGRGMLNSRENQFYRNLKDFRDSPIRALAPEEAITALS